MIRKALNYMEDHYHEDISLESISEVVFLNKNYFQSCLRRRLGNHLSSILRNTVWKGEASAGDQWF